MTPEEETAALARHIARQAARGVPADEVQLFAGTFTDEHAAIWKENYQPTPATAINALPTPFVRVDYAPHPEAGHNGAVFTHRETVSVRCGPLPAGVTAASIELMRWRKRKSGRRGDGWVHPAGSHYGTDGTLIEGRTVTVPVDDPNEWIVFPLGAWWKQGTVHIVDRSDRVTNRLDMPVSTGDKSVGSTGAWSRSGPRWRSLGGTVTQRFAFRVAATVDGARVVGDVSDAVVGRPVRAATQASPMWSLSNGTGQGVSTSWVCWWVDGARRTPVLR